MRRRTGFTILELLIVIGILAVLMALLFPVIRRVRVISLDTLCVNRLRDLSQASTWALQQSGSYPLPSTSHVAGFPQQGLPINSPVPHEIEARLLNDLSAPLAYGPLTGGVPAERLPPRVQCPFVEPDPGRGPLVSSQTEYYYTGYIYCVGLGPVQTKPPVITASSKQPPPTPTVLKDRRSPGQFGDGEGVLWADDVHWSSLTGWQFAHSNPAAAAPSPLGTAPLTFGAPSRLRGQHRAYTNGSVRWVPAAEMNLDGNAAASTPDASASYKIGSGLYWWF